MGRRGTQGPRVLIAADEGSDAIVERLLYEGFCHVRGVLTPDQIDVFCEDARALFEGEIVASQGYAGPPEYANRYRQPAFGAEGWSLFLNVVGVSERMDTVIESIYSHPLLVHVFRNVLGTGYKLWMTTVRCSEPGDGGLGVHQDQPAELGVCVLLTETSSRSGAMSLWPGSHRFPVTAAEVGLDYTPARVFSPVMQTVVGEPGDVIVFFNDVWHGRRSNRTGSRELMFISSMFASGSSFDRLGFSIPESVLASVGSELRNLLDHQRGVVELDDGRLQVVAEDEELPPHALVRQLNERSACRRELSPRWRIARLLGKSLGLVTRNAGRAI